MSEASPTETARSRGTVLVTGAAGFTGRYLRAELQQAGYAVAGLTLDNPGTSDLRSDLTDRDGLEAVLGRVAPHYVVHLAGVSFVGHQDTAEFRRVNVDGSRNLLEACLALRPLPRKVILASSANVYGLPRAEPIGEDHPLAPVNEYGHSKLAMEELARRMFDRLPIIIARPFNYTGVGQDARFVVPKIVGHFQSGAPTLELGDTSVVRDLSDVRDVAQIYRRLLESECDGETVNLCSGSGVSLVQIIDMLSDITGRRPHVSFSTQLVRAAEIPRLVGSAGKLERIIGRRPARPFRATLEWMYRTRGA